MLSCMTYKILLFCIVGIVQPATCRTCTGIMLLIFMKRAISKVLLLSPLQFSGIRSSGAVSGFVCATVNNNLVGGVASVRSIFCRES